jgi:guanylate kinase
MNVQPSFGSLLIVCGPAGSGKTTLCDQLRAEFASVHRVVTTTSRQPRPGEVHGEDYHFLSPEEFRAGIDAGHFIEWAHVHGRYYGTAKKTILDGLAAGKDLLLNIDVQGADHYRTMARENPVLAARLTTVFIELPSEDELRKRLLERGTDDEAEIQRRLASARREMEEAPKFDHRIVSSTRRADYEAFREIFLKRRRG